MKHICWDGCMFPNAMLENQDLEHDPGTKSRDSSLDLLARLQVPPEITFEIYCYV
jgi:hypothetical protein